RMGEAPLALTPRTGAFVLVVSAHLARGVSGHRARSDCRHASLLDLQAGTAGRQGQFYASGFRLDVDPDTVLVLHRHRTLTTDDGSLGASRGIGTVEIVELGEIVDLASRGDGSSSDVDQ